MIFQSVLSQCKLLNSFRQQVKYFNSWQRLKSHVNRGKVLVSNIHFSAPASAKLYVEKENEYAHEVLQNNNYNIFTILQLDNVEKNYPVDIELPTNVNSDMTNDEILQNFKNIMIYCKKFDIQISDEKFDKFVDLFVEKCRNFTDEQLLECLKFLSLLPETHGINTRNFLEIWEALDGACQPRVENWSIDQLLLVCDHWYGLRLARTSEFVWIAIKKLGRKIRKMTPQQLVHTMFFFNVIRKSVFEMFDFEINLEKSIDALTLKEIGVMSMGFFKTQTPIRNPELLAKIYERLIKELDTVEDITLVNILKVLRYSSKLGQTDLMKELLDKICPQIDRISLLSSLHVSLTGCDIQLYHEKSIELVLHKINREFNQTRLKDMERICHVISLFDVHTTSKIEDELCLKVLHEIKERTDEIARFPRCYPNCLHYLSMRGLYDEEMISAALDQNFIKHAYGRNMLLGREIFCIDSYARINLKDTYTGNKLQDRQRRTMGKCLSNYIPERNPKYKLSVTDRIMLEIKENCEELYKTCTMKHVLPHFQRPDIVICYDKEKQKILPVSKNCPADYSGSILTRGDLLGDNEKPSVETIIVVVAGWNNFIRNTNRLTGLLKLKINQLEILGHRVVIVPWFEWRELENIQDRHQFIRRKLNSLIS